MTGTFSCNPHSSKAQNTRNTGTEYPMFRWQKLLNFSIMQYKGSREVLLEI